MSAGIYEGAVATTPEEIRQLGKGDWIKYDLVTLYRAKIHFYRMPERNGELKSYLL